MKENTLDVLMYLFQNYMDSELEFEPDRDTLHTELLEAGFTLSEVDKAFDWLDGLAHIQDSPRAGLQATSSIRVYTRQQRRAGGAWEACAIWETKDPNKSQAYYEIELPPLSQSYPHS